MFLLYPHYYYITQQGLTDKKPLFGFIVYHNFSVIIFSEELLETAVFNIMLLHLCYL